MPPGPPTPAQVPTGPQMSTATGPLPGVAQQPAAAASHGAAHPQNGYATPTGVAPQRVFDPGSGSGDPTSPAGVPAVTPPLPATPGWVTTPQPWTGAPTPSAMTQALPSAEVAAPGRAGPLGGVLDRAEYRARVWGSRLRGQWGRRPSNVAVLAGFTVTLAGLFVGLAVGGPVLGHEGRPLVALGGAAAFGAGALWASKGWAGAGRRLRMFAAVVSLLLGASFTVGTLTNPVVVDGQVYLSTSAEARSYRLLQQIRTDLLRLADADRYLTFNAAQAGAHFSEYGPLLAELTALSDKYARLGDDPASLPDPRFADVVQYTTAASFWAARAVESKVQVIEADNARSRSDLASHRASYAEAVIGAGEQLLALSGQLNLPLTQIGPTE